jgi:hypothetical protein
MSVVRVGRVRNPMIGRSLRLCAAVLLVLPTLTGASAEANDSGFIFRRVAPEPMLDARTFVLVGTRTNAGCEFHYPILVATPEDPVREQRDLGVDLKSCQKLVEEGVPTNEWTPTLGGHATKVLGRTTSGRVPGVAAPALGNGIASGYAKVWWEDCCTLTTSYDISYLSWTFSAGCVTGYSASGEWGWDSGNFWYLVSNGGTSSMGCSRALADTWSTMRNDRFCSPATVVTYYPLVRASGWYDGTISEEGWDQSHTDTGCPLPLFRNHVVRITG